MKTTTQLISARVHGGFLDKADRLFRNDDAGVWIELLQNARRAGATKATVSIQDSGSNTSCIVIIEDNGGGIENFQDLLSLGASGWAEETQAKEDPAGMGFFSLCRSEVKIQSGNQFVTISPAVFLGKSTAEVQAASDFVEGTRLQFTRDSPKAAFVTALEGVAEFCPLNVFVDDRQLPQHDFLDGALYRELIDGIEVGFATEFRHRYSTYHDANWNFYGSRIEHGFPSIPGFLPPGKISPATLHARFKVLETGRVKLQLPDRRGIIEDEMFKLFLKKARAAAYRFFKTQQRHALPFRNWDEAKQLGILLPEAAALLHTWHAEPLDDAIEPLFGYPEQRLVENVDNAILVSANLPDQHTIEGALHSGATLTGELYKEEPQFAGYLWYDKLPRIIDSVVFVDGISYDEWSNTERVRPGQIEIEITVGQGGEPSHSLRLPAFIHVRASEGLSFVAVRQSPWDGEELAGPFPIADFLTCATFCASDDCESDSWQTQREAYDAEVEREVNAYFRGARATLMAILRKAIEWEADRLATDLGVTEIRFIRSGAHFWEVDLTSSPKTGPAQL